VTPRSRDREELLLRQGSRRRRRAEYLREEKLDDAFNPQPRRGVDGAIAPRRVRLLRERQQVRAVVGHGADLVVEDPVGGDALLGVVPVRQHTIQDRLDPLER
jgi:hypothetical protein